MKIVSLVLATACVAVLASAPLHAQSAGDRSGNASPSGPVMHAPTHPGANEWARDRDWYRRPGWPPNGYGYMGPWMMGPHASGMMGPRAGWMGRHACWRHHHRQRGARFTFTRGNARVDIQCPANQSLKDCVDAAGTLLDKVMRMNPPPPPSAPKPPVPNGAKDGGAGRGGKAPTDKAPDNTPAPSGKQL
ncbi:MAG: hypothetical protein P8Z80_03325 [Pseudolabrys sp.]